MTDIEKKIYFANIVLGRIERLEVPVLMYKEEKDVVKEALQLYLKELDKVTL